MATTLAGIVGKTLGKFLNKSIISTVNQAIFSKKIHSIGKINKRSQDHQKALGYGQKIPIVFGSMPVTGALLWQSEIVEHCNKNAKFIKLQRVVEENYTYTVSLMIGICQGPISSIGRIWADDQPIYDLSNFRLYLGEQDQAIDPLIASIYGGASQAPSYPNLAYILVENFNITPFGNRIPNFTFEVHNHNREADSLENNVKSLVIIPGSGEFVYDTEIQYCKNDKMAAINQHEEPGRANALVSLDQLGKQLPKVEWLAPVVSWFADNLNIDDCIIKPGVESRDKITYPDEWQVGKFLRNSAHLIKTVEGKLNYGGTTSDKSITRYLKAMRVKGYKIMFYPMLFIDKAEKPWRGKMTGDYTAVEGFFKQYREFILHYAFLTRGLVDAFLIGSELEGLTKIQSPNGEFLVIAELKKLAEEVKDILGKEVKISYAANWSEYHSYNGYYHMDELWASEAIDFIGIDAYFPLSDSQESLYKHQSIIEGWDSGEGYDFFLENGEKKLLEPPYAWKNIEHWLDNFHYNPDGTKSAWKPGSKKIWFTEYGFPSVTCSTNQPNRFFDSSSIESSIPKHSNGKVDILAQRVAIEATEMRWKESSAVERLFLWCWDARPYPTWPNLMEVWSDAPNWQRGHWINGKIGLMTLQEVVKKLWLQAGLDPDQLDLTELHGIVKGLLIENNQSLLEVIATLKRVYNFELVEMDGKMKFISHHNSIIYSQIADKDLIDSVESNGNEEDNNSQSFFVHCGPTSNQNMLYYYYNNKLEQVSFELSLGEEKNTQNTISLPCLLSEKDLQQIAIREIYNLKSKEIQYNFLLRIEFKKNQIIRAGLIIEYNKTKLLIVTVKFLSEYLIKVTAIPYSSLCHHKQDLTMLPIRDTITPNSNLNASHFLQIIPSRLSNQAIELIIASHAKNWLGVRISYEDHLGVKHHRLIKNNCISGEIIEINNLQSNQTTIDRKSTIKVRIYNGSLSSISQEDLFNTRKNLALCNNRLIQFQKAYLQKDGDYLLKNIIYITNDGNLNEKYSSFLLLEEDKIITINSSQDIKLLVENRLDMLGISYSDSVEYSLKANRSLESKIFNIELEEDKLSWDSEIITEELFPEVNQVLFQLEFTDKFGRVLMTTSTNESFYYISNSIKFHQVTILLFYKNQIVSDKKTFINPTFA